MPAERQINSATLLSCSSCKVEQSHVCFTAKQARRDPDRRRCRRCIESWENTEAHSIKVAERKSARAAQEAEREAAAKAQAAAQAAAAASSSSPADEAIDSVGDPLRLARKAETVLRARTERIVLICENCTDDLNHVAILRTAEALGVMRVWLVEAPNAAPSADDADSGGGGTRGPHADLRKLATSRAARRLEARAAQRGFEGNRLFSVRRAQLYASHLDVRTFTSTAACIDAARADGRQLWVTDLSQDATPLDHDHVALAAELPARLAVVVGSEGVGVSKTMIAAADRRVFLPMYGFTESFNISVAAALVMQRLLDASSESRGKLPAAEVATLRREWYAQLARNQSQQALFAALAESGGAEPFRDTRRPETHRDEQRSHGGRKACYGGDEARGLVARV